VVPPTNGSGNAGGGHAALNDLMSALVQPAHRRVHLRHARYVACHRELEPMKLPRRRFLQLAGAAAAGLERLQERA
jgi:hypothetical protein